MIYYGFDGQRISQDEWMLLFESKERLLRQEHIGPYWISTVWLGLDHGFGRSEEPLIFETMIFREGEGIEEMRHATKEEALAWHEHWVEQARVLARVE